MPHQSAGLELSRQKTTPSSKRLLAGRGRDSLHDVPWGSIGRQAAAYHVMRRSYAPYQLVAVKARGGEFATTAVSSGLVVLILGVASCEVGCPARADSP